MHDSGQTLPPAFLDRLRRIVPEDQFDRIVRTFHEAHVTAFRVNTLLARKDEVAAELTSLGLDLHPVPWYADAFWIESDERAQLLSSRPYLAQEIYVQNLSSMIPVLLLDPQPGERVLDLAAAPGSKTLQIAARMQNEGEIAAVEVVRSRFFKLREQLKAQGATAVRTFLKNGEDVWRVRPEHFDRVLIDAPCSTEGRFEAGDPESYRYWSPRKIKEMASKQQRLLFSAIQSLRPGGTLVYSTCTFAPEENEAVISRMLERFEGGLELVDTSLDVPEMSPGLKSWDGKDFAPDIEKTARVLPDARMEAFYVARFRKTDSTL